MAQRNNVLKKLKIPLIPAVADSGGSTYETQTYDLKLVRDYSGFTFGEIMTLGLFSYSLLLRDSIICTLGKTEEGSEMLRKAWLLEQTEPEVKELDSKAVMILGE